MEGYISPNVNDTLEQYGFTAESANEYVRNTWLAQVSRAFHGRLHTTNRLHSMSWVRLIHV